MLNIGRKMKRIIYAAVLCTCMTGIAHADSFSFKILSSDIGYNSGGIYKTANNPNVMIHVDHHLAKMRSEGGNQEYSIVDYSTKTNFIVIASNAVQITDPVVLGTRETCHTRFYSREHRGTVYLRGNSTRAGKDFFDYVVSGVWDPNSTYGQ